MTPTCHLRKQINFAFFLIDTIMISTGFPLGNIQRLFIVIFTRSKSEAAPLLGIILSCSCPQFLHISRLHVGRLGESLEVDLTVRIWQNQTAQINPYFIIDLVQEIFHRDHHCLRANNPWQEE